MTSQSASRCSMQPTSLASSPWTRIHKATSPSINNFAGLSAATQSSTASAQHHLATVVSGDARHAEMLQRGIIGENILHYSKLETFNLISLQIQNQNPYGVDSSMN